MHLGVTQFAGKAEGFSDLGLMLTRERNWAVERLQN